MNLQWNKVGNWNTADKIGQETVFLVKLREQKFWTFTTFSGGFHGESLIVCIDFTRFHSVDIYKTIHSSKNESFWCFCEWERRPNVIVLTSSRCCQEMICWPRGVTNNDVLVVQFELTNRLMPFSWLDRRWKPWMGCMYDEIHLVVNLKMKEFVAIILPCITSTKKVSGKLRMFSLQFNL